MGLLGPPVMPVCTFSAPLIATRNLQNHLEKPVFFVYNPFSEAIFSIVCFIAWLRGQISTFLHRILPHFVQKCSQHSVLQKRKLMQHMFRKPNIKANQYHFGTIPCNASRHDFVLMQLPASACMLPFADRKLYAEHKLKGGGVPSPEGLQLNKKHMLDRYSIYA